jgi:aminoglycoside 6'-N-acetyltransferase I
MRIRRYRHEDLAEWMRMRVALWPEMESDGSDPEAEAADFSARVDAVVLVAERADGAGLAGFVEVGERAFADGCNSAPVAYLEGWSVDADVRGQGVGRALILAAVEWARERGYREFASDALLENVESQRAHEAVGFEEVERAVRYRKAL